MPFIYTLSLGDRLVKAQSKNGLQGTIDALFPTAEYECSDELALEGGLCGSSFDEPFGFSDSSP